MADIVKVNFDYLRIEKDKRKICTCNPPKYELDTTNRLVICVSCRAIVDPFDALLSLCEHWNDIERKLNSAIEWSKHWTEQGEKARKMHFRNEAFKNMDKQYHNGMYPVCPKCGEVIDPLDFREYYNSKFIQGE